MANVFPIVRNPADGIARNLVEAADTLLVGTIDRATAGILNIGRTVAGDVRIGNFTAGSDTVIDGDTISLDSNLTANFTVSSATAADISLILRCLNPGIGGANIDMDGKSATLDLTAGSFVITGDGANVPVSIDNDAAAVPNVLFTGTGLRGSAGLDAQITVFANDALNTIAATQNVYFLSRAPVGSVSTDNLAAYLVCQRQAATAGDMLACVRAEAAVVGASGAVNAQLISTSAGTGAVDIDILSTITNGASVANATLDVDCLNSGAGTAIAGINAKTTINIGTSNIAGRAANINIGTNCVAGTSRQITIGTQAAGIDTDVFVYGGSFLLDTRTPLGTVSLNAGDTLTLNMDANSASNKEVAFTADNVGVGGAWVVLQDGSFFVNPGSNFRKLLDDMVLNTYGGTIHLSPGTHDINWTAAVTLGENIKIVGSTLGTSVVRFTSNDLDCCMNFTDICVIENVWFTRSGVMTNQTYALRLQANGSVVRDCSFYVDPQSGVTACAIQVDGAACVIENCNFVTPFPTTYLIYASGTADALRVDKCSSVAHTSTYFIGCADGASDVRVTNCFMDGSDANGIYITGANSKGWFISDNRIKATVAAGGGCLLNLVAAAGFSYHTITSNRFELSQAADLSNTSAVIIGRAGTIVTDNMFDMVLLDNGNIAAVPSYACLYIANHEVVVKGNVFNADSCKCAIMLADSYGAVNLYKVTIVGNSVSGLDVAGGGAGPAYCVYLITAGGGLHPVSCNISANNFMGNKTVETWGVYPGAASECQYCTVVGNTFKDFVVGQEIQRDPGFVNSQFGECVSDEVTTFPVGDQTYVVDGGVAGSTYFRTLVNYLTAAGSAANIILGPGYHDVDFAGAININVPLHITGTGPGAVGTSSTIRFTVNNVNCCLNFTVPVILEDVCFTNSLVMATQAYAISFTGKGSVIKNCLFDGVDPQSGGASDCVILVDSERCVIENCFFDSCAPADCVVYFAGNANMSSMIGCETDGCMTPCLVIVDGNTDVKILDNNFVVGPDGDCAIQVDADASRTLIQGNYVYVGVAGVGADLLSLNVVQGTDPGYHRIIGNHFYFDQADDFHGNSVVYLGQSNTVFEANTMVVSYLDFDNTASDTPNYACIRVANNKVTVSNNNITATNCKCVIYVDGRYNAASIYGVGICGNTIEGYDVDGAASKCYAIFMYTTAANGASEFPVGGVINGNVIRSATGGADVWGVRPLPGHTADYWSVIGNTFMDVPANQSIYSDNFDYSSIMGNTDTNAALNSTVSATGVADNNQYGATGSTDTTGANS